MGKILGYVFGAIFVVAILFCLAVLIYGGVTNMTFTDVLQSWVNAIAPATTTPTAHIGIVG